VFELLDPFLEGFRLHVGLVAAMAVTAQRLQPVILDAVLAQRSSQRILIELWVMATARKMPDIDQTLDPVALEQVDEFLDGARRVAHGEDGLGNLFGGGAPGQLAAFLLEQAALFAHLPLCYVVGFGAGCNWYAFCQRAMPANLTPEFLAAEEEYRQAQSIEEKIAALQKMLATVPKHKGTEKIQAEIKRKLSQFRKEAQKKSGPRHTPHWVIKREGAGQVVLVGPPNAGKSSLLAALTHAQPEIADYPYTTRDPIPGMMYYEDVPIQLVDLPPISAEFTERWIPQVVRAADLALLVVGLNDPAILEELDFVLQYLEEKRLVEPRWLVANKIDVPGAEGTLAILQDLYGDRFEYLPVSAATGVNLDRIREVAFRALDVVRMYSKPPGKPPDLSQPYILKRGQTAQEAAALVHRDFAEKLKFARLYRPDGGVWGLMVERTYVVQDRDILEFHV